VFAQREGLRILKVMRSLLILLTVLSFPSPRQTCAQVPARDTVELARWCTSGPAVVTFYARTIVRQSRTRCSGSVFRTVFPPPEFGKARWFPELSWFRCDLSEDGIVVSTIMSLVWPESVSGTGDRGECSRPCVAEWMLKCDLAILRLMTWPACHLPLRDSDTVEGRGASLQIGTLSVGNVSSALCLALARFGRDDGRRAGVLSRRCADHPGNSGVFDRCAGRLMRDQ